MAQDSLPPVTLRGDIVVRDRGAEFHVWRVTWDGVVDPKPAAPFTTDRRHVAIEKALDMARGTDGRVFIVDRTGAWTLVRRPGAPDWPEGR